MRHGLIIEPLVLHPDTLPVLTAWFKAQWPAWYGSGRGNAQSDLRSFANEGCLPLGVVAMRGAEVCGVAALKQESIESHRHLSPWAAAGLVKAELRGQGIGMQLLGALEQRAVALGYKKIYCGTSTAERLLRRAGWQLRERITHEGEPLGIFQKAL